MKYKIAIAILSYNRYEYLIKCLTSLKDSKIQGIRLLIIDDHSSDVRVRRYLEKFDISGVKIEKIFLRYRRGYPNILVKKAIKHFQRKNQKYDFWGIIDNDMIFKKNWLKYLLSQYEVAKNLNLKISFLTAFNASWICPDGGGAPIKKIYENERGSFGLKDYVGGAQLLFSTKIVNEFGWFKLKKTGWDRQWSQKSYKKGYKILVALPSHVQHIGAIGIHSENDKYDKALDF